MIREHRVRSGSKKTRDRKLVGYDPAFAKWRWGRPEHPARSSSHCSPELQVMFSPCLLPHVDDLVLHLGHAAEIDDEGLARTLGHLASPLLLLARGVTDPWAQTKLRSESLGNSRLPPADARRELPNSQRPA